MDSLRLRASRLGSVGQCQRYAWHMLRGDEGRHSEYVERAFFDGRIHEPSIIDWAAGTFNLDVVSAQDDLALDVEGVTVTGHPDAIARDADGNLVIIEAKALSAYSFRKAKEAGTFAAEHAQYITQLRFYMLASGARRGLLVARNKETPKARAYEHFHEWVNEDGGFMGELSGIATRAKEIGALEEAPPPLSPPSWKCSPTWCEYFHLCPVERTPKGEPAAVPDDIEEAVERVAALREERAAVEAELKQAEERLRAFFEASGVRSVTAGKLIATFNERVSRRLDTDALRKELGDIGRFYAEKRYYEIKVKEVE